MQHEEFFLNIETHYKSKRPFVAYRKPNESIIKSILQEDDELHFVTDFTENGFVFSPFDSNEATIIFPFESSKITSIKNPIIPQIKQNKRSTDVTEFNRQQHLDLVQKGIESILENELKKVVLSRVAQVPILGVHPIEIFKLLLKTYDTAFVYIWYHPKVGLWLGATPETLLFVDGKRIKTVALAGTQVYQNTSKVIWDSKNRDEQEFVTNFITEALVPFVDDLETSEAQTIKAGQLLHLQSEVSGVLKSKLLKDVIFALHPTPAVCGLPKAIAKDFILKNEHYNREFYTGFLGELNLKTAQTRNHNRRNVENNAYLTIKQVSQLYVNLRCMQLKDQHALLYVGGGITKDSNAEQEWEETLSKAQTMLAVLQ